MNADMIQRLQDELDRSRDKIAKDIAKAERLRELAARARRLQLADADHYERQAREADARVVNRQAIAATVEERLTKARKRANVNMTRAATAPVGGVAPAPRPPAVNGDSTNQLARAARAVLKAEPGLSYKEVASRLAAEGYTASRADVSRAMRPTSSTSGTRRSAKRGDANRPSRQQERDLGSVQVPRRDAARPTLPEQNPAYQPSDAEIAKAAAAILRDRRATNSDIAVHLRAQGWSVSGTDVGRALGAAKQPSRLALPSVAPRGRLSDPRWVPDKCVVCDRQLEALYNGRCANCQGLSLQDQR